MILTEQFLNLRRGADTGILISFLSWDHDHLLSYFTILFCLLSMDGR